LNVRVISPLELTSDEKDAWHMVLLQNSNFDSPFFHPDFTMAVAAVRTDTEIAVLEKGNKAVGFFPFQRDWAGIGRPIGRPFSDVQAVVTEDSTWTAEDLIRGCRLKAWDFDNLLTWQRNFAPYFTSTRPFFQIDVSGGFEAYRAKRRAMGSHHIRALNRTVKRMERDIGPVRFEPKSNDKDVLKTLLRWKSEQYRRSFFKDTLRIPWVVNMLNRIHDIQGKDFSGILSALYVADHLVAAHLGMCSRRVWHYWLPSYDPAFSTYSPGQIMQLQMILSAEEMGIERIDDDPNPFFRTGSVLVAEGSVGLPCLTNSVRRRWGRIQKNTVHKIRESFLVRPARTSYRVYRRVADFLHL
jgi:CelD/BcsL family acetyltransferase involved in cellulose biosynthesis